MILSATPISLSATATSRNNIVACTHKSVSKKLQKESFMFINSEENLNLINNLQLRTKSRSVGAT